jgi:Ca2+:H+ antiporter
MSSLLTIASASFVVSATIYNVYGSSENSPREEMALLLSHGSAIILLALYFLYLFFYLRSHYDLFHQEPGALDQNEEINLADLSSRTLNPVAASFKILIMLILVASCANYLISSISSISHASQIPRSFFGTVLIPIAINLVEQGNTCVSAFRDRMDLVIRLSIGNSLQTALFIIPVSVIVGWIFDRHMTFHFDMFQVTVVFMSVYVVTILIGRGKSNYLLGLLCLAL